MIKPEIAGEEIRQLRAQIETVFLRELKRAHHRCRVLQKKIRVFGMQLPVRDYEIIRSLFLAARFQRQKTEERRASFPRSGRWRIAP